MTAHAPCQVCGAPERRLFIRHQEMDLYECLACGLVYLDPMPGAETARALYTDALEGATAGYFAKVAKKMRRSRHRVRQIVRQLGRQLGPGHNGRFLDVGASGGFMVEAAREAGFEAWGVELDPVSVAYAREHFPGNRYHEGTIESFHLGEAGEAGFDAVYCSEVIEHVADANGFVAGIARAMRPGGVLYLTTPDISSPRRPRDVTRWEAFTPPGHCLYFNPRNLARLLARHGLDVYKRRFAWKPGIKLFARRR